MEAEPAINILAVDDSRENLTSLRAVLERPGVNVVTAASGPEALKRLLDEEIAVILLDVQMPGMDGFETAALLRQREKTRDIPVIFMTATDPTQISVFRGYAVGAVDYLFKPVDPEILKSKIAVFLELFRKTAALAHANEALRAEVAERRQIEEVLRENEQRLNLALDAGDMGAWELDLVHDTAIRTLKHDQIFGYQSLQPQWGADIFMGHVFPGDRESVRKAFDDALASDRLWFECRIIWPDQSLHWITAHGLVYRDPKGAPLTMRGIVMDITKRKQAEEQIARLNADLQAGTVHLQEANKELESFSYSVSHDLRAPLRHVQGYVEMLQRATDGQLSNQAQRYLNTISAASVEMGQMIDALLALSRIGRAEVLESRVDVDRLVQQTIRGEEMSTKDRHVVWQVAALPAVVGDPALLKQVLTNLIGNAVKYSRDRDPAQIEIGCAGEEDGHVILFVRDNGAGFDMQYAHKLFGVFQRLHRAEEFEGTGIGLATVRRIVARHGGRVWAEGAVNQGATFYFTLQPWPTTSR